MAVIPGAVPVAGFIGPTDDTDVYAVIDPIYGIDGLRSVADLTERNNITTQRRRHGMLVFVRSNGNYYQLESDLTSWVDLGPTLGGGNVGSEISGTIATTLNYEHVLGQTVDFKAKKLILSLITASKSYAEEILVSKDHTDIIVPGYSLVRYTVIGDILADIELDISGPDLVLRITNNELVTLTYTILNDYVSVGGSAHTIEDEGTPLPQQPIINFTGSGVSVSDSGGKTVVNIPGGGSPPDADAVTKGILRLTNDLSGTADNPTVPAIETNTVLNRYRRGYNDTGSTIVAFKFAGLTTGYFSNYPKIKVADLTSPTIGLVTSNLANLSNDKLLYYGLIQFPSGIIDTTSIPLNTPVYCNSTGDLTLTSTIVLVGHTMSQGISPWILLNVKYNPSRYQEYPFVSLTNQTFNHNFNRYPSVIVLEGTEDITSGVQVLHPDNNSVTIVSNIAITGKVICSCD